MSTTMTSKGQVTIPKALREHLGLRPGQGVDFDLAADGRVVVSKAGRARPRSRFAKLRGVAGRGPSTEAIMALTRGEG
jgi:AbrB family looped-hinge helix DNA binding protein